MIFGIKLPQFKQFNDSQMFIIVSYMASFYEKILQKKYVTECFKSKLSKVNIEKISQIAQHNALVLL